MDHSATTMLTADATGSFRTMLEAGRGAETANSSLIVAGGEDAQPADFLGDGQLWISSNERVSEMMNRRVLRPMGDGWRLEELRDRREVHSPPLVSTREEVPVRLGMNLRRRIGRRGITGREAL